MKQRAMQYLAHFAAIALAATGFAHDAPVVDGVDAAHVFPAAAEGGVERTLIAPHIQPVRIDLPDTNPPAEFLLRRELHAADLNGDGVIDAEDVLLMISAMGDCRPDTSCSADLNSDGFVDEEDLVLLLALLGRTVDREASSHRRLKVGYVSDAPPGLLDVAQFAGLPDGMQAMRMELHSPGAEGLRVRLTNFTAVSEVQLRVYDPNGAAIRGPYSAPILDPDGGWWSPIIFGDAIGLEFVSRSKVHDQAELPEIESIAYLYCGVRCHGGPGNALQCHNDVTCYPTWADDHARAVGAMGFIDNGDCLVCTGAVLNRLGSDLSPLFMTADHCINNQAAANSVEIRWLYQTATCDGTAPDFDAVPVTNGTLILKRHSNADWALLGLLEPPVSPFYLGWNANPWSTGNAASAVHHPAGSWKRITFSVVESMTSTMITVNDLSATTQGGSSGCPIMDNNRHVRGTLCCGPDPAQCPPHDDSISIYGRLDVAFTNLTYYLSNIASPNVFVNGGFPGDPGNNGNIEQGTSSNPFNTVHEATFAVISGEEVRVAPGIYNEQMTIWRPMSITADGGLVRIGAP